MLSTSHDTILHGYSVVRISLDDHRDDTVPVGVVAWDTAKSWYNWRWLDADENVPRVTSSARQFMRIAERQLAGWADHGSVPYEAKPVDPTSTRFWTAVSRIFTTAVRLDPPRAMDPMVEPDQEIEALFEAIVQPSQSQARQQERIDHSLSRALGDGKNRFQSGVLVSAFGNVKEKVRRGTKTERGTVVIEGVNLAARAARKEADALVSRLTRIQRAHAEGHLHIIVGYSSSPGGLNGEAHMRDWIREALTHDIYDLSHDDEAFRRAADSAWRRVANPEQQTLDFDEQTGRIAADR